MVFTRVGRLVPEVAWMRPRSAPILALCLNESIGVLANVASRRAVGGAALGMTGEPE